MKTNFNPWPDRAHTLEDGLMWSASAEQAALDYLATGRADKARDVLAASVGKAKQALTDFRAAKDDDFAELDRAVADLRRQVAEVSQ